MRLSQPFFQLPVLFDSARLQAETAALPVAAWVPHPDGVPGNSAARLIAVDGGETDLHHGRMLPTRWLDAMPYARQILAGFGVVWSRARLMRLAPGASIPEHADINHHWHTRVRVHIPIFTWPEVRFHCDGEAVHMAGGEAWIFDNWRRHHVVNGAGAARIHLVADTTGTAAFWQFACGTMLPRRQWRRLPWQPDSAPTLLTECDQRLPIMPAAELQMLVDDLCAELAAAPDTVESTTRARRFSLLLESFVLDWRQLCALHGLDGRTPGDFLRLANAVHTSARSLAAGLVTSTNGASALLVFEKRILEHLVVSISHDRSHG